MSVATYIQAPSAISSYQAKSLSGTSEIHWSRTLFCIATLVMELLVFALIVLWPWQPLE